MLKMVWPLVLVYRNIWKTKIPLSSHDCWRPYNGHRPSAEHCCHRYLSHTAEGWMDSLAEWHIAAPLFQRLFHLSWVGWISTPVWDRYSSQSRFTFFDGREQNLLSDCQQLSTFGISMEMYDAISSLSFWLVFQEKRLLMVLLLGFSFSTWKNCLVWVDLHKVLL